MRSTSLAPTASNDFWFWPQSDWTSLQKSSKDISLSSPLLVICWLRLRANSISLLQKSDSSCNEKLKLGLFIGYGVHLLIFPEETKTKSVIPGRTTFLFRCFLTSGPMCAKRQWILMANCYGLLKFFLLYSRKFPCNIPYLAEKVFSWRGTFSMSLKQALKFCHGNQSLGIWLTSFEDIPQIHISMFNTTLTAYPNWLP